jgi:iron complex outermembrane receptor protein
MAYTNGGNDGSGPNLTISPSTSENYELGTKFFISNTSNVNIAFFRTNTTNEIVVKKGGTYIAYWNAGQTVREGIEASFDSHLNNNLDLYLAYTFLDARFASIFNNGTTTVNNQNVIPGTYRTQLYGELAYKYPSLGFSTALETRYNSKVFVNDANSDYAPSYTIVNLRAGFEQNLSSWKINEYARIENIFDKDYIGSVRINDSNNRFFEAAPGINALAGISATYKF